MAAISKASRSRKGQGALPPLENGDRLDQKTFHERYKAMKDHVRAELIGGTVYMASPLKPPHGRTSSDAIMWIGHFRLATPGTDNMGNTTSILGPHSEPQPDACLYVLPEYGGQVWFDAEGYLAGAPDLLLEIGSSTESIDLNAKKLDYEKAGVREYLVVAIRRKKVFWFFRHRGHFKEISPGPDGILRSQVFPGLWLDPDALLKRDTERLLAMLQEGLQSPEHGAFVAKLQAAATRGGNG